MPRRKAGASSKGPRAKRPRRATGTRASAGAEGRAGAPRAFMASLERRVARIEAGPAGGQPPPVIVLHGLTASVLRDEYPVDPETVLTREPLGPKKWDRVLLHPDNLSFEANEPARVRASHHVPIGYGELIKALRTELCPSEDRPVPVYPFSFDWRDGIFASAERLGEFIREIIGRTRLLKHYPTDLAEVDLVGHSMGGMVISACLARGHHMEKGRPLVRQVATIATPYHGAVDALEKLAVGESEIFGEGRDAERHFARLTPSVYQHVPEFPEALLDEADRPVSAFDPLNWQHSIFGTLAEHLRIYSRDPQFQDPAKRAQAAFATLSAWLAEGKKVQAAVNGLDPKAVLLDNTGPGRHPGWLVLTGVDEPTKYQAALRVANGERVFEFRQEKDGYDPDGDDDPAVVRPLVDTRSRLGDGTVAIRGAIPDWADRDRVVAMARRDFGKLENLPLKGFASLHAILPWLNLVHRWIIAFFKDKDAGKAKITARPLFDVAQPAWQSPVVGAALKA
jgi:pimeloyl-ACP methyl ester carboxylesterase